MGAGRRTAVGKQESLTFSLTRCFGGKKEKQIRALRKKVKKMKTSWADSVGAI